LALNIWGVQNFVSWDSPYDSRIGVDIGVFPTFLQDRREVPTVTGLYVVMAKWLSGIISAARSSIRTTASSPPANLDGAKGRNGS
jgi:hypothetical protein